MLVVERMLRELVKGYVRHRIYRWWTMKSRSLRNLDLSHYIYSVRENDFIILLRKTIQYIKDRAE